MTNGETGIRQIVQKNLGSYVLSGGALLACLQPLPDAVAFIWTSGCVIGQCREHARYVVVHAQFR
jgi:hypothetical protein